MLRSRLKKRKICRSSLARITALTFNNILNKNGYAGSLKFDHANKNLDMTVVVDHESTENRKVKDTASLSGGERSYTTLVGVREGGDGGDGEAAVVAKRKTSVWACKPASPCGLAGWRVDASKGRLTCNCMEVTRPKGGPHISPSSSEIRQGSRGRLRAGLRAGLRGVYLDVGRYSKI